MVLPLALTGWLCAGPGPSSLLGAFSSDRPGSPKPLVASRFLVGFLATPMSGYCPPASPKAAGRGAPQRPSHGSPVAPSNRKSLPTFPEDAHDPPLIVVLNA